MQHSLTLLKSFVRLGGFKSVKIYILLNKLDISAGKITRIPIANFFPEYTGGTDCFAACKFFADMFYTVGCRLGTTPYVFPISAVSRDSMKDVSLSIRDLIEPCRTYNFTTAWSWAAMDPGLRRERRTYMQTITPNTDDQSHETKGVLDTRGADIGISNAIHG